MQEHRGTQLVDKLSPAAEIIGACNVFVNDDGVITGHITDGVGFVKNLELNGVPVKTKRLLFLEQAESLQQFRFSWHWTEQKK